MTAAAERVPASGDRAQRERRAGVDGIWGLAVLYLPGPVAVIVYGEFVARRLHSAPGAILVTSTLVVPVGIELVRILAPVFEIPLLPFRIRTGSARPHRSQPRRVLA